MRCYKIVVRGKATGVGVLQDGDGRRIEALEDMQRCIGVEQIVERKLLALDLSRPRDRSLVAGLITVERGRLVRVFAVAQILYFFEA